MNQEIQFMPEQASSVAGRIDALYLFLWAMSGFFTLLIFVLIVYMGLKYRRRDERMPAAVRTDKRLEYAWTVLPLFIVMGLFGWASALYVQLTRIPENAMEVYVLGKQWMWHIQHPSGAREINTLHVPVGRPIKLTMTSQDVIHSFFIPAMRIKQDVLPGRYSTQWFTPTQVGEYHLFCTEFCGDLHSKMIGTVVVMEESQYQAWMSGANKDEPMHKAGERLFAQYGCASCHGQQGPTMAGLFGKRVQLADGSTVIADEAYLRESILNAPAKLVAGFPPLMPSYRGQLTEEQIAQLIVYIKSLKEPDRDF